MALQLKASENPHQQTSISRDVFFPFQAASQRVFSLMVCEPISGGLESGS